MVQNRWYTISKHNEAGDDVLEKKWGPNALLPDGTNVNEDPLFLLLGRPSPQRPRRFQDTREPSKWGSLKLERRGAWYPQIFHSDSR
ncbi:hypothetical protein FA13DRAFT_308454 [Coprinellus micaceus]|uniref:Uncharacterized protein n=1 Tax=Coprinellus micaceus TaxID=71717 RepID=A0A4Y7TCD3_COPMI|nr:hypothetical protein FA13DRAFT_308454 [Coprinellus micaceus]